MQRQLEARGDQICTNADSPSHVRYCIATALPAASEFRGPKNPKFYILNPETLNPGTLSPETLNSTP